MKTRNLFLSLFAFAALCACNKEAQPEVPAVLENDAFVAINICTAGENMTKADPTDGGYVAGTSDEYTVNNAYFLFYNDGEFSQAAPYTLTFNAHPDKNTTDANVEMVSEAIIVLKGKTITPNQILVLLNASDDIKGAVMGKSLSEVQAIVENYSDYTTNGFLMSNSVYHNGTKTVCAATIEGDNIKSTEDAARTASVNVYVERVLSKVVVNQKSGMADKMDDDATVQVDGVDVALKHEILGYAVTPQIDKSYLVKNIEGIYGTSGYWANWNDPSNYRSYWAVNPTGTNFTYSTFTQADNAYSTGEFFCYPQENVDQVNNPKLLVVAQIQNASTSAAFTAFKYMDKFYTPEGFKNLALINLQNAGIKKNTTEALVAADLEDYSPDVDDSDPYKPYDAALKLTTAVKALMTPEAIAAAEAVLGDLGTAQCWKNGYCYYYVDIEHFGTFDGDHLSGLVRNHQYQITVNSISGWGTPVYDPSDPIVPEKPADDEYSYVAATINILKWKVVNQNVDLQ